MDELMVPWAQTAARRQRYVVAVSGGADSVALLHLLLDHGLRNLVVCHLNHRLRGRAAAGDAAFVRQLAARHHLACEVGSADVARLARARGTSLELTARVERHGWFAEVAKRHRTRQVVLGHHVDDQCETILFNLCRGSAGLRGMATTTTHKIGRRTLTFIRPLLHLHHRDLVAYLAARNLSFREDTSNQEPFTVRNRLRHEAIPLLEEICARQIGPAMARAEQLHREQAEALATIAAEIRSTDPQGRLHLPTLRPLPRGLQREVLFRFLTSAGVPQLDHWLLDRALAMLAGHGPARINLPGGRFLRRKEQRMFVEAGP